MRRLADSTTGRRRDVTRSEDRVHPATNRVALLLVRAAQVRDLVVQAGHVSVQVKGEIRRRRAAKVDQAQAPVVLVALAKGHFLVVRIVDRAVPVVRA